LFAVSSKSRFTALMGVNPILNLKTGGYMFSIKSKIVVGVLATAFLMGSVQAQTAVAEFNSATGILLIPEAKVGATSVYNAKLQYDGTQNFKLLGYDTKPTPATPPLTSVATIQEWLTTGVYKAWKCEAAPHAGTGSSPHGTVRVCSSPSISATTTGSYPVGATSVKELYTGSNITGYALGVKVTEGAGASTWHWYETINGNVVANAVAAGACEGCHSKASNDRVFIRVP
jgi:hypothetical protein